jgi:hypothetical protein
MEEGKLLDKEKLESRKDKGKQVHHKEWISY